MKAIAEVPVNAKIAWLNFESELAVNMANDFGGCIDQTSNQTLLEFYKNTYYVIQSILKDYDPEHVTNSFEDALIIMAESKNELFEEVTKTDEIQPEPGN